MKISKLILLAALTAAQAWCARTTVTDTLYTPSGALFNGSLYLASSTAFVASDGNVVVPSQQRVQVTNGIFTIPLEPNDTGVPSGTSYVVNYQLTGGLPLRETWVVPTSGSPIGLASVRTINPPAPGSLITLSQLASGGASAGNCIVFTTSWGPGTCSGVLTTPLDFAAQTPGGTLTAATPATITLTPCPLGVAGADVGHALYISAGTGTAEAFTINGGTCTSGATTGTVTFTPANSHSGAWTIQSASSGIQEAWNAANGGIVLVPPGTYLVYAPITLNGPGAINCGAASFPSGGSILQSQTATQDIIDTNSAYPVVITNCNFDAAATKTAGAAIKVACGSTCTPTPNFRVWAGLNISHNIFNHQFVGIDIEAAGGYVIEKNVITGTVATGTDLILRNIYDPVAADDLVDGNFIDSPSAINILAEAAGVKIANNKILHGNYGILLQVPDGAILTDALITANSIEGQTTAGLFMRRKGPSNTGYWGSLQITGNQIAGVHSSDTCILSRSLGADNKSVQFVDIRLNNISYCDTGIDVATNLAEIQDNTLLPQVKGIVTTGSTNTVVQNNTMLSYGTAANNYILSADTLLTDSSTGILFANLPTVKNGSLVFCADCVAGTFNAAVAGSGTGIDALMANGAWRVH